MRDKLYWRGPGTLRLRDPVEVIFIDQPIPTHRCPREEVKRWINAGKACDKTSAEERNEARAKVQANLAASRKREDKEAAKREREEEKAAEKRADEEDKAKKAAEEEAEKKAREGSK